MEKKDQYVAKLHSTIDAWSAKLDQAEAKVKGFQADTNRRYEQAIKTLNARLSELKSRARELERAGEGTWDAIRRSVEVGIEEFKREWKSAREDKNLQELEALPPAGESAARKEKPRAQA
jgi:hypothetical protein